MPTGKKLSLDLKTKILQKFNAGQKQSVIAKELNLNKSVISKTLKKYSIRQTLESPLKTGRPRKTDRMDDRRIKNLSQKDPFKSASQIKSELPYLNVSVRTIRRRLQAIGLYGRRPAKKPFISCKNRQERLEFARNHVSWTEVQWNSVLFSDETKIQLFSSDSMG